MMRTKSELDSAMAQAGFKPHAATGGYKRDALWVSASQAREALRAAKNDESWTEDDVEPLSETLARTLTKAGIK